MKKISSFLLTFVLITSFTACSQQTERTMWNGTDLTPWLSQREDTDVWFTVSGRKITGPDGAQPAYDIVPLLMDITVGQKLEYSDDMDDKLKAVNGEYVVALTDKNSERKLHLLTFYNEFTVMAATDDMKLNYYYIAGAEKLKEYFADHNQYITPERYTDIISCVNKYIAENAADYPQLNQNMQLEDFDVEIYGIKDAPGYHIYGEADDGNEDCDVHIRINADKAGALTVTDFNVYDD